MGRGWKNGPAVSLEMGQKIRKNGPIRVLLSKRLGVRGRGPTRMKSVKRGRSPSWSWKER